MLGCWLLAKHLHSDVGAVVDTHLHSDVGVVVATHTVVAAGDTPTQ